MISSSETHSERPEDKVIDAFVKHLGATYFPGLKITDRPDRRRGSSREIDAIATGPSARIAIEHTSVDSLPDNRTDYARFLDILAPLEHDLHGVFTYPVHIGVAFGTMPEKGSRAKISTTVKDWLITNEPAIRDGEAKENFHIPGVPFGIDVARLPDGPPGLILGRLTSPDPSLPDRIRYQLNDKADKLKKYKADRFHTILLVECPDLA